MFQWTYLKKKPEKTPKSNKHNLSMFASKSNMSMFICNQSWFILLYFIPI